MRLFGIRSVVWDPAGKLGTMYLIGLDFGTTNLKALLYAADGNIVRKAAVPTPTHTPDGFAEFYADELFERVLHPGAPAPAALTSADARLPRPLCPRRAALDHRLPGPPGRRAYTRPASRPGAPCASLPLQRFSCLAPRV